MPIIDPVFRAQHEVKAEWAREVERTSHSKLACRLCFER
jgi:hypothetical protein